MMSAGFQWGGVPNKELTHQSSSSNTSNTSSDTSDKHTTDSHIPRYGSSTSSSSSSSSSSAHTISHSSTVATSLKKRKRDDTSEDNLHINNGITSRKYFHHNHHSNTTTSTTSNNSSTSTSSIKYKRSKTPKIIGQPLPLHRLIESLDKSNLQKLVQDLIIIHPELQSTMTKIAPKPSIQDSLDLLHDKFNLIMSHLPYKCDVESDYSYLRIKPHLQEFLSCISDFILNYLPPLENNLIHSLHFLEEVTKMIIYNLPNFTNQEFQYIKATALDQLANCWLIVLSQSENNLNNNLNININTINTNNNNSTTTNNNNEIEDIATNIIEVVKIIQEFEVLEKLHKHNEVSLNKFQKVIDYCNDKLEQHDLIINNGNVTTNSSINHNGAVPASLSDLISVDYSKYSLTNT